jgi:hypothetical protein
MVFSCCISSIPLNAQVHFSGFLFDMDSRKGIEGAVFILTSKKTQQSLSAATDASGKYQFLLPAGWEEDEYPMILQKDGYYSVNGIVLVQKNVTRNFYMKSMPRKEPSLTVIPEEPALKTEKSMALQHLPPRYPPSHLTLLLYLTCNKGSSTIAEIQTGLLEVAKTLRPNNHISIIVHDHQEEAISTMNGPINYSEIQLAMSNIKCTDLPLHFKAFSKAYQIAQNQYAAHGNNSLVLISDQLSDAVPTVERGKIEQLIQSFTAKRVRFKAIHFSSAPEKSGPPSPPSLNIGTSKVISAHSSQSLGDLLIQLMNEPIQ